ncbi:MAG: GNAT family N-acetyltransferase [Phycisphaeraceae bacterium]|nr:GNAT family N-acetyltransferase [Phycisphaeraceae bacterium]
MTRSAPNPPAKQGPSPEFSIVRVGEELLLAAAQRLVSQSLKDRISAARRLIASAPEHGIDLSYIWASIEPTELGKRPAAVRQACLAVPGSGRTAMIFMSEPSPNADGAGAPAHVLETAREERIALLNAIAAHFSQSPGEPVRVLQALPEPGDAWAETAFRGAGFLCVGDLEYRRKALSPAEHKPTSKRIDWPAGIRVVPIASLPQEERDPLLLRVLEETYVDTRDCPELCGVRATSDILASHYATGVFDPALWFIVFVQDAKAKEVAAGCMLLNRVPEQRALELVYVGLSKPARGRGIGAKLMELAMLRAAEPRIDAITCAVDCRNEPALRMYERFAFGALGRRRAFVRRVGGMSSG